MRHIFRYILLLSLGLFLSNCNHQEKSQDEALNDSNEILIYCENSMLPPLLEIKNKFEESSNCKVRIQNDCSKNLIALINYTQKGDIYIPASRSSLSGLKDSTITDSLFIGYNELVFMVKKDNPLKFNGSLNTLLSRDYAIIIANPETSSLGEDTKKLFSADDYTKLLKNTVALSTDSKGLIKSLSNNETDIVISWRNTFYSELNSDIEMIEMENPDIATKEVYAGFLKYSKNTNHAQEFIALTLSDYGYSVLKRYGISKRKMFIF